jgi:hypothetical protein
MMGNMKDRILAAVFGLMALLLAPATALAEDEVQVDARLDTYKGVKVEGTTALMWLLLILLAAVCLAGLFKNARRSHLD